MAVMVAHERGWVVSHSLFLRQIYTNVAVEGGPGKKVKFRESFFDIKSPFFRDLEAGKVAAQMEARNMTAEKEAGEVTPEKEAGKVTLGMKVGKVIAEMEAGKVGTKMEAMGVTVDMKRCKHSVVLCAHDCRNRDLALCEKTKKKRRKNRCQEDMDRVRKMQEKILMIQENAEELLEFCQQCCAVFLPAPTPEEVRQNNRLLRTAVTDFAQDSASIRFPSPSFGQNTKKHALQKTIAGHNYILPVNCTFYCDNVKNLSKLTSNKQKFDLIVIDPPWWNKFIRRKKARTDNQWYDMIDKDDLLELPVGDLAAPGCLVVVWCTNSPSHVAAVKEEIFPCWTVEKCVEWYWVKVTQSGETVCKFSLDEAHCMGKQPYEHLILGLIPGERGACVAPDQGKVIISVPSGIHSHKPPLCEVLAAHLPPHPQCLELFARSLLPGWTSWGAEVLKLQDTRLYEQYS